MQLNGSQIFVEVLCEQGVDTLFGYPGGAVLNLYDELYKNADRITHVLTAHEQGASHAADGYARATGRTGVVLATSGPGATNLVTGIATAYMDSVPMVAFTGNVATEGLGKDGFQEAYIEGITMPITKHNFTVRRVEDLADTMRAAFRIAQSGRKGPVLVDIPKDVTAAVCEFTPKKPEPIRTVTTFNEEQVKWAAEIINGAQRPLVYFGGGVRSAASCQPLRDLLKKAEIPATYTLMAAGVVPYGDPMNIGMVGMHGCYTSNRAVADCDVLIAVGARFSDRVALKPDTFARQARIVHIDIDRAEINKNVQTDHHIVGDAKQVLRLLLERVPSPCAQPCPAHSRLIGNMITVLAEKNVRLMDKNRILSRRSTREKLLAYLDIQARAASSREFELPFSRQELADYLCVERSAMTVELMKLDREGLIRVRGRRITLGRRESDA